MVGRAISSRAEPGFTLPAFERLAPPPPPDLLVARLEAMTEPGDIVADLHGRGGWVARAAIDRQRRALTLETSPLTRLLAEIVLRPPDLRHLDAAFSALAASPRGETSLKFAVGAPFATHCPTCGRGLIADEFSWAFDESSRGSADGSAEPRLVRKSYRCTICRDQRGRMEQRLAPPDDADLAAATADVGAEAVRAHLRERFPVPDGAAGLPEAILRLHTDRQLVGLAAILERIEADLRAAPVESALRLALLHAILPASRFGGAPGHLPSIRIAGGVIRSPFPDPWRERNPWVAFEDGFRVVRGFVQRTESGALGPLEARFGTDLRSLAEGAATAVVRLSSPGALRALVAEDGAARGGERQGAEPRIRLVIGQPPIRFSQERLAAAYVGTGWALGHEAALLLPIDALAGSAIRAPWSWQAAALRRSLEAVVPLMAGDGRAVLLLESGGPEALVASVLAGVGAGYRLLEARLSDEDEDGGGLVELAPPGAQLAPGRRTRSGRPLAAEPGGAGDPDFVPGPGLFSAPERIDARPFSRPEAARAITDTAVEVLRARGEPAGYERLLGEVLIGLDRAGHLRRLVALEDREGSAANVPQPGDRDHGGPSREAPEGAAADLVPDHRPDAPAGGSRAVPSHAAHPLVRAARTGQAEAERDPVDRLIALVRDELEAPAQRRVREIAPGSWWLADPRDLQGAAVPLSDRVEWATYSLLSTAGPLTETAFFERMAGLFGGYDLPDAALVRACLASYRGPASTADRLVTGEDLRRRTAEHTELLARLTDAGHRLGMSVWIGRREQVRRFGAGTLGDLLSGRELSVWLPSVAQARAEDLEEVDCIWYVRGRAALLFEIEWTAMLGDVLLRRHARIPGGDDLIKFLVVPPERRALIGHKLAGSSVLRAAIEADNWHLILWPHLRAWLANDPPRLEGLEAHLGLDPAVERRGEQLPLFDGPDRSERVP